MSALTQNTPLATKRGADLLARLRQTRIVGGLSDTDVTAVAVAGVVISAIYGLRAAARVFFGPASEQLQRVTAQHPPADLDWREKLPALILIVALLFFGFYPKAVSQPVDQALAAPVPAAVTLPSR